MPPEKTRDLVELLPWSLRRDTERYLASVRENATEIFHQAGVTYSSQRLDALLLLAAVQKLWATVNTQAWIVDSSLGLLDQERMGLNRAARVEGLRLGRSTYTRTSSEYLSLQQLRADLDKTLRRLEIRDVVRRASLVDLARNLGDRKSRGR